MAPKKTWKEKLSDKKDLPKVVKIEGKMSKRWGSGTVAIPAPIEVDEIMKKVPKGKVITINETREIVAKRHKATIGCPITTGIFAWIASHAAYEDLQAGKKEITPYWRTLKTGGEINPKYPGYPDEIINLLEAEGNKIKTKGKKFIVEDYDKNLAGIK
jgi:hypothetical protein